MLLNSDSKSNSAFQSFTQGLTTPFRAVGLILFDPRLLMLSALPILFSCAILAFTFYALMAGLGGWLTHTLAIWMLPYSGFVQFFLSALLVVVFLLSSTNVLMILTTLISSPLNDFLAEGTEKALGEPQIKTTFFYLVKVFFLDLRKTFLTLSLSIICSLGLLIPVLGLPFFLGLALLNAFTFITYPQNRRAHGVRDSLRWISQNFWLALGFGVTTTFLFSLPVFNLFAIPLSVVGGTMLFLKK